MKTLENYAVNGTEFSINLHTIKMGSGTEVMFITITKFDTSKYDGADYTVVLNGLPTVKLIEKACGVDFKAAESIIKALQEKAVDEACEFWGFLPDEWVNNLDYVLADYKSKKLAEREERQRKREETRMSREWRLANAERAK